MATLVVAPHPFLSRVTIIANNYHGIHPRFRNVLAIAIGHNKGGFAQLDENLSAAKLRGENFKIYMGPKEHQTFRFHGLYG